MGQGLREGDPTEVGGIVLVGRLGEGGSSVVYEGRLPDGTAVAVKVLHPELAASSDVRQRLRTEGVALQRVRGRGTARVESIDADGSPPHLVMELVRGSTLQAVAEEEPLSGPMLYALVEGLIDALEAMHANGVVHRDLKPQNVIFGPDGVKVVDFGTSVLQEVAGSTRTGVLVGTPSWVAPEQAMGGRVTSATDVFNLGMLLAFAATGRHPFGEGRPDAMLFRIVHEEPDLSALPSALRSLAHDCLVKDPSLRPTLDDLRRRLASITGADLEGSVPASATRTASRTVMGRAAAAEVLVARARRREPSRERVWNRWAIAVLATSVLAVSGVFFVRTSEAEGPVAYTVAYSAVSANPVLTVPTLRISGPSGVSEIPVRPTKVDTWTLDDRSTWSRDEPLTIAYVPSFAADEAFSTTLDLAELGANVLSDGRHVHVDVEVATDEVRLVISVPTVIGFLQTRRVVEEVTLVRQNQQEARAIATGERVRCTDSTRRAWRQGLESYLELFDEYAAAERDRGITEGGSQTYEVFRARWQRLITDMDLQQANLYRVAIPSEFAAGDALYDVQAAHAALQLAWMIIREASYSEEWGTFGETIYVREWNEMYRARQELWSASARLSTVVNSSAAELCETRFPRP